MIRDTELSLFQKIILCTLAAMTVVFAVATFISRSQGGVLFEETLLDIAYEGNQTIYSGKKYGEEITIACWKENGTDMVDVTIGDRYHTLCRVEYPEGTITTQHGQEIPRMQIFRDSQMLFNGGYSPDMSQTVGRYYNEDGTWEPFISIKAGYSNDPWYNYEFTESDILYFANVPHISVRGSWTGYMVTLLISIFAAIEVAFPETLFYLSHRWHVRDPEPTDFYYAMHKLSCVVVTGMVLVLHIISLSQIE